MSDRGFLPGRVMITRIASNQELTRCVRIRILDESSHTEMVEVSMSLEEFSMALFGRGDVPCDCGWGSLEVLGKRRENKTEIVAFPDFSYKRDATAKKIVRKTIAALEVDGWEGRDDDAFNGYNREGASNAYRIVFIRFVTVEK